MLIRLSDGMEVPQDVTGHIFKSLKLEGGLEEQHCHDRKHASSNGVQMASALPCWLLLASLVGFCPWLGLDPPSLMVALPFSH